MADADDISAAISASVDGTVDGMVTKWVALVESIDPDGTRGLWRLTSEGLMAWDTIGMLQHALNELAYPQED